jgi:hypothetical protein
LLGDGHAAIGRPIVDDDAFPVLKRLIDDTLQCEAAVQDQASNGIFTLLRMNA